MVYFLDMGDIRGSRNRGTGTMVYFLDMGDIRGSRNRVQEPWFTS